jgi:hypothetical protein
MATPAKSRTGLYIGLGAVGAGAYYLYRAGGNPKAAKEEMKYDVNKARAKAPGPGEGERAGQTAGLETNLNIDEAVRLTSPLIIKSGWENVFHRERPANEGCYRPTTPAHGTMTSPHRLRESWMR